MTKKELLCTMEPNKEDCYVLYRPIGIVSWNAGDPKVLYKNELLERLEIGSVKPVLWSLSPKECMDIIRCKLDTPAYESLLEQMMDAMVKGFEFIEDRSVEHPSYNGADKYQYAVKFNNVSTKDLPTEKKVPSLIIAVEKFAISRSAIEASPDELAPGTIPVWFNVRSDILEHHEGLVELQVDFYDCKGLPTPYFKVDTLGLVYDDHGDDTPTVGLDKFKISPVTNEESDVCFKVDEMFDALLSACATELPAQPFPKLIDWMLKHPSSNDEMECLFNSFFHDEIDLEDTLEDRVNAISAAITAMGGNVSSEDKERITTIVSNAFEEKGDKAE